MSNNNTKLIRSSIYIILLIIIIGYSVYNSRILIKGPEIIVSEPLNGSSITDSPLIRVVGSATNIAFIELNGKQINVNKESVFNEPVLLYPGYNIIEISAVDKFERKVSKKIELVYKNNDLKNDDINEAVEININLEKSTSTIETATSSPINSLEEI